MTKKILILDCGCQNFNRGGTLNHHFSDVMNLELTAMGHEVKVTRVGEEWDVAEEAQKMQWADAVIVQTPGWWMTTPWQFVRYMDLVWVQKGVCGNDGRTHDEPKKNYGRGGILTDKHYMISSTWNAPKEAFTEPDQFFEGKGADGVFFPLHKAFQFLGLKPLPSFMANDVVKNPTIESDIERLKAHIKVLFG